MIMIATHTSHVREEIKELGSPIGIPGRVVLPGPVQSDEKLSVDIRVGRSFAEGSLGKDKHQTNTEVP